MRRPQKTQQKKQKWVEEVQSLNIDECSKSVLIVIKRRIVKLTKIDQQMALSLCANHKLIKALWNSWFNQSWWSIQMFIFVQTFIKKQTSIIKCT